MDKLEEQKLSKYFDSYYYGVIITIYSHYNREETGTESSLRPNMPDSDDSGTTKDINCLGSHVSSSCSITEPKCNICHKVGHVMHMCISHMVEINERSKKKREAKPSTSSNASGSGTFLQTFTCLIFNPQVATKFLEIRGILDSGSKKSYINKGVCHKLGVKSNGTSSLACFHFGSSESYDIDTQDFSLTISSHFSSKQRNYTLTSTLCITGSFRTCPEPSVVRTHLPKNLKYADEDIFKSEQPSLDILIGQNLYNELVDVFNPRRVSNGLILYNSFFGLIPSGNIPDQTIKTPVLLTGSFNEPLAANSSAHNNYSYDNCDNGTYTELTLNVNENDRSDFSDLSDLSMFWSFEIIGIKLSEVDIVWDKVIEQYTKTRYIKDNRYVVCWPWIHSNPNLPSNYRIAKAHLRSLVSSSSPELMKAINDIFTDYISKGIIELAPKNTRYLRHYLPHSGIKQKGKIRIVFDGSSKLKNEHSINELIHKGPSLHENIPKLLMNFQTNAVAITADIEKAFL